MKEKDKTREQLIEELEKLHQELHLYRMIVEKMPLALTVWELEDLDNPGSFRLLACNPQIEKATGAPYQEFVGTTVRETFPSSLETEGPHIYAEAVRSGQVRELSDLRFPGDEQTAAGVYSVTVVPLGGRIAAMFCENITERQRAEEALRQREAVLEAMALAAEKFLRPSDWEQDMQAALAYLGKAADAIRVIIWEASTSEDGKCLVSGRYEWIAPEAKLAPQVGLQNVPVFRRWRDLLPRGEIITGYVRDFSAKEQEFFVPWGIASVLAVPIFVHDAWWGFMGFDQGETGREWTEAEIDTLKTAASMFGGALERKRAEEEIKQRNRELAALNAIATTMMQSALDLDEVLRRIADGVVEGLGCNTAVIVLLDEKEGAFKGGAVSTKGKVVERINAIIGFPLVQIKFPARSDFNEAVSNALNGQITIKHDLYELVSPALSKLVCSALQGLLGSRTFLSLPLLARGRVLGGIFASTTREELTEGDIETIMTFGNQAALAIKNARLYEEAQQEITERRRVEKELGESEVRYRALVESSYDHIFMLDRSGTYLASNDQVGQFGLESGESLVGCHLRDVYPPEVAEFYRGQLEQVLTTGQAVYFEHHMPEPDGRRYHLDTLYPIRSDGEVWALGGICRDITERRQAQEDLRQSLERLQMTLEGTVNSLASAIEMRDPYTAGHQRRVTQLACAIAEEMGLPGEQIDGLRLAGLVHDIGKINVPAEILSKPGPLTELEFGLIKMHPQVGYDILKEIEFPWPVAQIVLQHHERMDGSGYPQGLSGEEIILEARILAVADVVEAMSSHRPYRPSRGIDEALEEISHNRGILYDPEVVDACLKLFAEKGFKLE
jgi:PAS domain S-box-containing protein/putative nucleotidyltransferase with HDIG domain